jgi:hypothetical protein
MSETKHTPGPWTYQRSPSDTCDFEVCSSELLIAGEYGIEDEANARLIAASPKMYDYIAAKAAAGDDEARAIVEAIHAAR